jgi:hypothetical protein
MIFFDVLISFSVKSIIILSKVININLVVTKREIALLQRYILKYYVEQKWYLHK